MEPWKGQINKIYASEGVIRMTQWQFIKPFKSCIIIRLAHSENQRLSFSPTYRGSFRECSSGVYNNERANQDMLLILNSAPFLKLCPYLLLCLSHQLLYLWTETHESQFLWASTHKCTHHATTPVRWWGDAEVRHNRRHRQVLLLLIDYWRFMCVDLSQLLHRIQKLWQFHLCVR